ncbi:hypothetical protein AYI69_g6741 [Smittium culicis]|uniref:Uncharacterized protein n=1 Tax=Smittium culicis TaxID=133412 RepID=A0A1R1XX38_9FUNG|nr:hypothetical protein AYI69_g6741 [Smittium culicis]
MELNLESGSEGQTGTTDSNTDCTYMKISNIFPRPDLIINIPTASDSGDNNSSRTQKRKIAVNREQKLESDGLADKRRVLQEQGFSDLAIEIVVPNERCIKRKSRYYHVQQRFLDLRICNNITSAISAPQVVNYLAEIYRESNLKVTKIRAYKTALLLLVDNPETLESTQLLKEFFLH